MEVLIKTKYPKFLAPSREDNDVLLGQAGDFTTRLEKEKGKEEESPFNFPVGRRSWPPKMWLKNAVKLWHGLRSCWVRPSDKSSLVSSLGFGVTWDLGNLEEGSSPEFSPTTNLLRNSTLEITRTKRTWKTKETPLQTHLMAIVLLWDFQKRTAPNPLRAAWESGVDRTTDPWTKATVKSFTSKVKLILKGIQQHRQKNPTFPCTVQCHLQGKAAVDQRKLILTNLMPSEKAKSSRSTITSSHHIFLVRRLPWMREPGTQHVLRCVLQLPGCNLPCVRACTAQSQGIWGPNGNVTLFAVSAQTAQCTSDIKGTRKSFS